MVLNGNCFEEVYYRASLSQKSNSSIHRLLHLSFFFFLLLWQKTSIGFEAREKNTCLQEMSDELDLFFLLTLTLSKIKCHSCPAFVGAQEAFIEQLAEDPSHTVSQIFINHGATNMTRDVILFSTP